VGRLEGMRGQQAFRLMAIVVLAGLVSGCASPSPLTPDSIVREALRSSVDDVGAPVAYRSALLPAFAQLVGQKLMVAMSGTTQTPICSGGSSVAR